MNKKANQSTNQKQIGHWIKISVIIFIVLVIFIWLSSAISYIVYGNHSLGNLSYGGKFMSKHMETMADIVVRDYDGDYDYDIYSICGLIVFYYEEKGNRTLKKELEENKDAKEIMINNHKWYITNYEETEYEDTEDEYTEKRTYLFTSYKDRLYTVGMQNDKDCEEFSKKLMNSLKFKKIKIFN